jgi:hypothetical protein
LVRLLRERFVPVAVDQHIHRRLRDEEGKLFAAVLKQASRGLGGYSQGVYLFAPSGQLLAFANAADAAHVKRLLRTALAKFEPGAVGKVERVAKAAGPLPAPPPGGLVVRVAARVLGGYDKADERAKHHINSVGRDFLWLRKDEVTDLARGVLPESVKLRIARFHLIDNTRGEPPLWRADEVKKLELVLKDGRLTGSVHIQARSGARSYRAEVRGVVEARDGAVVRFDVVAKGLFRGEGTFTRGAPKGEFPFAVAFTLADGKSPADRVPPQGARGNVAGYLR